MLHQLWEMLVSASIESLEDLQEKSILVIRVVFNVIIVNVNIHHPVKQL